MFDQASKGNIIARVVRLNVPSVLSTPRNIQSEMKDVQHRQTKTLGVSADVTSDYLNGEDDDDEVTSAQLPLTCGFKLRCSSAVISYYCI